MVHLAWVTFKTVFFLWWVGIYQNSRFFFLVEEDGEGGGGGRGGGGIVRKNYII